MLRIVLTGGACAGKTTLAHALARRGARMVPEAAMQVIAMLRDELGLEQQARWRAAHVIEFQRRIARLQQESESHALLSSAPRVVYDRALPDGIAYFRHARVEPPEELLELARQAAYDAVFVLDTLRDFRARSDSGRLDDRGVSLALRDALLEVYRDLGYVPKLVPEMTIGERLLWIERELERMGWSQHRASS